MRALYVCACVRVCGRARKCACIDNDDNDDDEADDDDDDCDNGL